MSLQKYMAFIKTVECGNITRAAELLNYSQSGVSRMIVDLEEEWGVSLLQRGKNGVKPTSDGLKLLPHVRKLCAEFSALQMQVDEINGLQSGLIRIGTFSSVATHWLPGIIERFKRDYPNIDYELLLGDYTEIEEWIRTGRVDCGFLRMPVRGEFETEFLQRDRLMVVIPQEHRLKNCKVFPVKELCNEPFMLLEKGGKGEILEIFERNHLQPKIQFTTWDDYAVMSMVEKGLGIAILPELILQRIPYRILVKELSVPSYRDIGFVLKSKKTASVAVKRFMEYLQYR